ncbi:protein-export chaperone SecB [Sphingomonas alba]|uniref:Protein-export protein SecB n=1 Tax=Sphingomonas alba TaxID=2908208 RepID=A0ABT0RK50_9SPHN|nr:protein-export chaperone SecB [Sphingomonas alba]MCL6682852.1 protein-export chaperone SecB [Sphingomonas alba]
MADQDPNNANNGSGPEGAPQIAVLTQYIKDLSVECPNSPAVFQWQAQPQVDIQFNINVNNVSDEVHEVILKVNVAARSDNGAHFLIDLSYAGLLGLRNIPEDAIGPFLLIEAPRMLFPFVRQIVAEAVGNTGFPPLLLEPIDFNAAYIQQLNTLQGSEGGEPADGAGEAPAEGSDQTNS